MSYAAWSRQHFHRPLRERVAHAARAKSSELRKAFREFIRSFFAWYDIEI